MTAQPSIISLALAEITFREDLYPRFKPNPAKIQEYADNLALLPPIEVSQQHILIDGYHRLKAYETAGLEQIPCIVTQVKSEQELLMLAVRRNAAYGLMLTPDEKKRYAIRWWDVLPDEEIIAALSISRETYLKWTRDKQEEREKEQHQQVYDLWMRCETQADIANRVAVDQKTISNWVADFRNIGSEADFPSFRNFEGEDYEQHGRRIYTLWNFAKVTNEARIFGNIPPEIIDNLLYLYTKPFDVVFDPFGGGGSTIDICLQRKRRHYVSDLNPIPARSDIRKHDITKGLPDDLPVPDLVFLDPPYWRQSQGKYSNDPTDLANVDLETFLATIGNIARDVKRKWRTDHSGKLALIIGPWKEDGRFLDLPFLCYTQIAKYLNLNQRITVPYSTQVHGGNYVKMAKEKRELLYLTRDLMVFGYE